MNKKEVLDYIETQFHLPFGISKVSDDVSIRLKKRIIGFHRCSQSTIYIDVTDTDTCPIVTGIQRVARKVVECFAKDGVSFELIRYDFDLKGFVILSEQEKILFNNRIKPTAALVSTGWRSAVNDVIYKTARFFGRRISAVLNSDVGFFAEVREGLESSKPGLVRKIRSRKKRQYPLNPILPIEGMKILLPELIYEKGRAEQYLSLKEHFDSQITAVLYDLIPLYHPEFVEVSREFLHYLRVVRIAKHAVAISEYSGDQLATYLAGWKREQEAAIPNVKPLYLPFAKQTSMQQKSKLPKPTFLFVSTIEPRKNHLRLAQAAEVVSKSGYDFQVICVGKVGWVEQDAWSKIGEIQSRGAPISFRHNVDDGELKDLLLQSWCAIYPSVVEGFGLPIIEADGFDLPVIASNNSAMRDVCRNFVKCYYLVDPEDVGSIANGMKTFLDSSIEKFTKNNSFGEIPSSWEDYSRALYKILVS